MARQSLRGRSAENQGEDREEGQAPGEQEVAAACDPFAARGGSIGVAPEDAGGLLAGAVQPMVGAHDPHRQPRRFMVVDGPRDAQGKIRYNNDGYMVSFAPGKEVTEVSHNLPSMRKQGIRLELIPDEIVEDDEPMASALATA